MTKFEKRITSPKETESKYYSSNIFYQCGYGLPNCTCYAWGRWYELLGYKPKICTANAENWFKYNDGYKRGQTPKLGAIACWSKGKIGNASDGAGHVAVVEEIYSDGSILTSNSAWKSTLFYTKKLAKGYKLNGFTFLGFIYLPIEFEDNSIRYSISQTYKTQVILKVRKGAGTNYAQKTYEELTQNGRENAYKTGVNKGCLKAGTKVTIYELKEVDGNLWARIPSGWIALRYNNNYYVK